MTDDMDFYVETLNEDTTKYFFNGKWEDLVIKKEKVTVSLLANSTARIENLVRASLFLSTLIALGGTDIFLMADTVLF